LSVKLCPMMFHSSRALQKTTKILKKYQFSILGTKYHKGKIQTLV